MIPNLPESLRHTESSHYNEWLSTRWLVFNESLNMVEMMEVVDGRDSNFQVEELLLATTNSEKFIVRRVTPQFLLRENATYVGNSDDFVKLEPSLKNIFTLDSSSPVQGLTGFTWCVHKLAGTHVFLRAMPQRLTWGSFLQACTAFGGVRATPTQVRRETPKPISWWERL